MTFKNIRIYADRAAARFADAINSDHGSAIPKIEDEVLARAEHAGGALSNRKGDYLLKMFVVGCRNRGFNTRVVHALAPHARPAGAK